MKKKIIKTTTESLDAFLKRLISIEAEFAQHKLKLIGKKPLWQQWKGESIKIPKIKTNYAFPLNPELV